MMFIIYFLAIGTAIVIIAGIALLIANERWKKKHPLERHNPIPEFQSIASGDLDAIQNIPEGATIEIVRGDEPE